ncbi:hypothetical protein M9Y10_035229 [Tritrichomonas musculus]|uniref:Uncharacterized protein n=1 Tax=Tritrichomonas musculus TaxID=1915356 RepID=A0ABR2KH27_9EUKA
MNFGVETVLCILAFCINVIAATAYFYNFYGGQKITSGYSPDGKKGKWDYKKDANIGFYLDFSRLALGLVCLIFAIIEILLIFIPDKLTMVDSPLLRGIIYIISGIAVLGCANDLGIAAGALQMAIGLALVIFGIIGMVGH